MYQLQRDGSPHTPRKIRFVSVVWPSTIRFVRHSTRSSFDARYVKGVMSATQIWLRTSKVRLLYLRLTRPLYHVDRSHPHKVRLYVAIAKGMCEHGAPSLCNGYKKFHFVWMGSVHIMQRQSQDVNIAIVFCRCGGRFESLTSPPSRIRRRNHSQWKVG